MKAHDPIAQREEQRRIKLFVLPGKSPALTSFSP